MVRQQAVRMKTSKAERRLRKMYFFLILILFIAFY